LLNSNLIKNKDKFEFYQIYNIDLSQNAFERRIEKNVARQDLITNKFRKLQQLM